jgi:hypothetical protein
VEVLPVGRANFYAGADVLRDEIVVENDDLRCGATPVSVLENGRCARASVNDHMRWVLSAQARSLGDKLRPTRCEGPQYRGQGRLAARILGVDYRQSAEGELRAGGDIVELADVPQ